MSPFQPYSTILFVALSVSLFAQDPPVNNTYQTATELTVHTGSCSTQTLGDLTHATNTNDMDYRSFCVYSDFSIDDEFPYADVWYKATVPSSGNLAIQTTSAEESLMSRTVMVAYTLEGGVLTEIDCVDGSLSNYNSLLSKIIMTGQTPSTDIYFMVAEFENVKNGNTDHLGSFNICAYEPVVPINNSYETATELIVQPDSCSTQTFGNLFLATNSNGMDYRSECINSGGGYYETAYSDVWYKTIVPSSGNLAIQTSFADGSLLVSTVMVAYTLDGGVLTEIACDDSIGYNDFSSIELSSQTPNQDIYIMVVENNNQTGIGDSRLDSFNICAYEPSALEVLPPSKPLLSYYSNPVGNRLSVESSYHIRSLSVHDLSGREVLSQSPNKKQLIVDTYSLAPAVYLLRVQTSKGTQTVQLVKK